MFVKRPKTFSVLSFTRPHDVADDFHYILVTQKEVLRCFDRFLCNIIQKVVKKYSLRQCQKNHYGFPEE